jgi:hypothetical protein
MWGCRGEANNIRYYSLGGIVVKRALVEAKLDDTYKAIRDATYGIAFFGTPHQEGNFANLRDIVAYIVRGSFALFLSMI